MKRYVVVAVIAVGLFALVGFLITAIPKARMAADDLSCKNNLREIGLFAAQNSDPHFDRAKAMSSVPAGTIPNGRLPVDERLSWYVTVMPGFDQRRQNTASFLEGLDRTAGWNAEKNQAAARTKVVALLCPGNPPAVPADQPAVTSYVGIGGLGTDAPSLVWLPDGTPTTRSGCYRFDAPTPFESITDGLSQSLLIGERSNELGSWLAGGPATVRGLDNGPDARLLQGAGGQFGGCHPAGANWAFADGSVRLFTDRVDPKVLYGLSTIAGKDNDPLPGD
jgi:prepilin-type processing-associated H-X9-DG protein